MRTYNDYLYASAQQYLCNMANVDAAVDACVEDILESIDPHDLWEPFEHWDVDDVCAQIRQNATAFWDLTEGLRN